MIKNNVKTKKAQSAKPTNAQIIAELSHARCVFQLASICAFMGITPPLESGQHLQEQTNDRT